MQHLIQLSNFSELLNGQYEKRGTVGDVLRQANCGLGTFEGLDGELIILNGQAFKAIPGGEAYELSADTPLSFAQVFKTDTFPLQKVSIKQPVDLHSLSHQLAQSGLSIDTIWGLRAQGVFEHITVRSIGKQSLPFKPFSECADQAVSSIFSKIEGFLVGFYLPISFAENCGHGWHWHFIDKNLCLGGHVVDFSAAELVMQAWSLDKPKFV